jgi:hypothetical protein
MIKNKKISWKNLFRWQFLFKSDIFLTIIFIVLKLAKVIDWTWWFVMIPMGVPFIEAILNGLIGIAISIFIKNELISNKILAGEGYFVFLKSDFLFTFLFIFLKLLGIIDWSWWIITIPIGVPFILATLNIPGAYIFKDKFR